MTRQFPLNPDMRHLRAQAKGLLAGCRSADPLAISTIRTLYPRFSALRDEVIARSVRLCDTQSAIAHQYGASDWSQLNTTVNLACRNVQECSRAMRDPRLEDPGFRAQLAARKGLPPVGTSRVSACGVQYTVVDFLPAVSPQSYARVRSGRSAQHIEDLLPIIEFPDISPKLRELLIETDCATTKQIVFFDTMPEMHRGTAAPGLNQVCAIADENALFFHFDAADSHETIIAHELGHIWIEYVEGCEDYRQMQEPVDFARSSQFQHIQSFVLDLRVNQLLADRGFDMPIISDHEAESICNLAEQCARGNPPRYKRVEAHAINAVAAALIELPKFHSGSDRGLMDAFDMIRIAMPVAFEAALGFVASVERHGLGDTQAICRVVDDCATLSFGVTNDGIDLEKDLIEMPHPESPVDKHPEFLPQLPLSAKLDVFRKAAKLGMTGRAEYRLYVSPTGNASVTLKDPSDQNADSVQLVYRLPEPPPNARRMDGAPNPLGSRGNTYVPPPGLPRPNPNPPFPQPHAQLSGHGFVPPNMPHYGPTPTPHPAGFAAHGAMGEQYSGNSGFPQWGRAHAPDFGPNVPGVHQSNPNSVRTREIPGIAGTGVPAGWPKDLWSQPGFGHNPAADCYGQFPTSPGPGDPVRLSGPPNYHQPTTPPGNCGGQQRRQQPDQDRFESMHAVYSGTDLVPCLAPTASEKAALPSPPQHAESSVSRSYMAGFGLWISRVGFEQQALGEHPYAYAMNDPINYIDPDGKEPQRSPAVRANPKPEYPTQKTCAQVSKCLATDPNGWNCRAGHGCTKRHPISISLALCVMYHESRLDPDNGPNDNGGGLGQLLCPAIGDLQDSGCNRGVCCTDGDQQGVGGTDWCQGARAAYMWMQCRGLPAYGDSSYTPAQLARFKACEKCLNAGKPCLDCLHKVLRPGLKP